MTCFWSGCIKALKYYNLIKKSTKPKEFVQLLKTKNVKTSKVKWNYEIISDQQLNENYDAIRNYNADSINDGYYCFTCEPFLFLICEIFEINITHVYCGTKISYSYEGTAKKTLKFKSDEGHFWKL